LIEIMNYELSIGKGDTELLFSQTRGQLSLSQSILKLEELMVSAIALKLLQKVY